jgi:hypothetical protein
MLKWRSPIVAFIAALQLLVGGAFTPPNMLVAPGGAHHRASAFPIAGMAHHGHMEHTVGAHGSAGQSAAHDIHTQHSSGDQPCDTRCCDHCACCLGTVSVPAARVHIADVVEVPAAAPGPRFEHDVAPSSAPAHRLPFPLGPPTDRV